MGSLNERIASQKPEWEFRVSVECQVYLLIGRAGPYIETFNVVVLK